MKDTHFDEEHLSDLFAREPLPPSLRSWDQVRAHSSTTVVPSSRRPPRRRLGTAAAFAVVVLLTAVVRLWPTGAPPPVGPPSPDPVATSSWPDERSTGVPAGTTLATHVGDLHITEAGSVVSNLYVRGSVFVEAANVTLRNVKIVPPVDTDLALHQRPNAPDLVVERCEISNDGVHTLRFGLLQEARGLHLRGCHVSSVLIALTVMQGAEVADSLIDGLVDSPFTYGIATHGVADGPILIEHNTITIASTGGSAIGLLPTFGPSRGITVTGNLLAGGAYTLSAGGLANGTHDIVVVGNHISRRYAPLGGQLGPVTDWDGTRPGAMWRDNVWHESGSPLDPP